MSPTGFGLEKMTRPLKVKIQLCHRMPIWVSIKRTLTGKLVVGVQNFIYSVHFQENVQKPQKIAEF